MEKETIEMPENTKNYARMQGTVCLPFIYENTRFGERFYYSEMKVQRLSGRMDRIPFVVSERLTDTRVDLTEQRISICGQFRSYNVPDADGIHLVLRIFVTEFELSESERKTEKNDLFIDGFLCKKPFYHVTPRGKEVANLMVAVNRPTRSSDYIPCVCWGRNARYAAGLDIGTRLKLWGSLQSREYVKRDAESRKIKKTAYEFSASGYELVV
ncbi:MAG: single-stranded DNA-binding protein [Lachnospiraceae bacterium]|nr:single-stranded DNA-binding protein [Lachnospiraceae bacterium]